jgi:hypothetical protein
MEISLILIEKLKPAEYNPRKLSAPERKRIEESLAEFGIVQPAVINMHPGRENVIIGGHQRIDVAKSKGITEYPCHIVKLPLDAEKRLNLKLNKLSGEWDIEKLYHNFDKDILVDCGFSKFDLDLKFARIDMGKSLDVGLTDDEPKNKPEPIHFDSPADNNESMSEPEQEQGTTRSADFQEPVREKAKQGAKFYPMAIVLDNNENEEWQRLKQEFGLTGDKALLLRLCRDVQT